MKQYTILTEQGFRVGVLEFGNPAGLLDVQKITMVFFHGFSVSASAYTEMLELLAENGFHVYALDAPDHGASDSLPWGHTVADMVGVLDNALGELMVPGGCVLVGHSMGGWLAAELAALRPETIHTVILLNAAVGEEFHDGIHVAGPSVGLRAAQFVAGAVRDVLGDAREAGSIRRLSERLRWYDMLRGSLSGIGCLRAAWAMMHADSTGALHELKTHRVKTVVVHGMEDKLVPPVAAMSAAVAAAGRLRLLGGRFHSWMIADPAYALAVIREALDLTPNTDEAA